MKTKIYYFTGTGNSLFLAKKIAEKLDNTEILSISKALNDNEWITGEKIGIVFPVYMHRLPHLAAAFIKKIKSASYIFAIANNAGELGKSLRQTDSLLKENGLKLNSGFGVRMPSNYIPWGGAEPENKQKEYFDQAEKKIELIKDVIENQKNKIESETSWFRIHLIPGLLYALGYKFIPLQDKSFWVNDQCTKCGTCSKLCPVKNITYDANQKPVWNHKCEMCFACLQWCPAKAIEFGKRTAGKIRFQNPSIKINEMLI